MSKRVPPADDLRPEERYEDEKQLYHFRGQFETIRIETGMKGWIYTIPSLGISAGHLRVNNVNLSMDSGGHLYVGAYQVTHKPNEGVFGTIEILARDETTGSTPK